MRTSDWLGLSHVAISEARIDKNQNNLSKSHRTVGIGRVVPESNTEFPQPEEAVKGGQIKNKDSHHTQGHVTTSTALRSS